MERCSDPQQDVNAARAQLDEVLQVGAAFVSVLPVCSRVAAGKPNDTGIVDEEEQSSGEVANGCTHLVLLLHDLLSFIYLYNIPL